MTGRTPKNLEWHIWAAEDDKPAHAFGYTTEGAHLVVYAFAMQTTGSVDLVGLIVVPAPVGVSLPDYVQTLTDGYDRLLPVDAPALRATQLRLMTNTAGLVAMARNEIRRLGLRLVAFGNPPASTDITPEDVLASQRMALYAEEIAKGRGARKRFAQLMGVTDAKVKGWVEDAKRRGLWATDDRQGTGGQLTERAVSILEMEGKR